MNMKQRIFAILFAIILVIPSVTGIVSAADSAALIATEPQFVLELQTSEDANDSSIINVVVTIKDIQQELLAVEYELNFDTTLVEGVITESGVSMDAFMTVTPMYIMAYNGMEVSASRYEQICYYDITESQYECKFCDLLRYPFEKPGQEYKGLIKDGGLVVTIQFRKLDTVDKNEKITFSLTNIKGTAKDGIKIVPGIATSVFSKDEEVVTTTNEVTSTEGTTIGEVMTTEKVTSTEETMPGEVMTTNKVTVTEGTMPGEVMTTNKVTVTEGTMPGEVTTTKKVTSTEGTMAGEVTTTIKETTLEESRIEGTTIEGTRTEGITFGEVSTTEKGSIGEVLTKEEATTESVTIVETEITDERLDEEASTGISSMEEDASNNQELSGEKLEEEASTEETTEVPKVFVLSKRWYYFGLFILMLSFFIFTYKRKR